MKCKFTKELLSGKDIDLKEFNLGIIKQPKVQTFIEVVDSIEFIKPFYMVRYWNNNGSFEEVEMPFNIYYTLSQKNKSLLVDLILYLMILYDTKDIKLKNCGDKGYSIFIKSQDNIESFIDDSNFNVLSKIVLEIMYYDEPKKEIKQKNLIFREGDKVMQTKNNYNLKWTSITGIGESEGEGVFNGEMLYILKK